VPQKYKEDESLGKWVKLQRTSLKNGRMNPEQKDKLDGICWFRVRQK
jgi:hypothetical protein